VCRIIADYSPADVHVSAAHEHAHKGTDSDGHAHPADRHTYSHRDGDAGSADGDAILAHGDTPAGNPYSVRSGV
jgi:hypothetical protein